MNLFSRLSCPSSTWSPANWRRAPHSAPDDCFPVVGPADLRAAQTDLGDIGSTPHDRSSRTDGGGHLLWRARSITRRTVELTQGERPIFPPKPPQRARRCRQVRLSTSSPPRHKADSRVPCSSFSPCDLYVRRRREDATHPRRKARVVADGRAGVPSPTLVRRLAPFCTHPHGSP